MDGKRDETQAPVCPGCHFGCMLDRYQCGRGKGLYERWRAGEELPARRGPGGPGGPGGARGAHPQPALDERLMHMLGVTAHVLHGRREAPERRVAGTLMRHGSFAGLHILAERTQLPAGKLEQALQEMQGGGLVTVEADEHAGVFVHITEAGREQARVWDGERAHSDAEFLSALSDSDKQRLLDLIFKLLEPGRRAAEQRAGEQRGR